MTTPPDLPPIIAWAVREPDLRPRSDLGEPGWMFWELRTLNRHRVVGLLKEHRQFAEARDLGVEIRGVIARNFRCSWWRGMAYGVVAEVAAISMSPDDLKMLVDVRDNSRGTLQWIILVAGNAPAALGVHTWIEGFLSPVYRGTLQALAETGYQVARAKREKDGLMKVLTRAAHFPEFRDHP